jgi:hypothetical protein
MAITTIEGLKAAYPVLCERLEKEARGETTVSTVTVVKNGQGRMSTWTEESRDLDGILVSKRVDEYSYYLTDEINEIIQEEYEGETLVSKKKLKHYKDGTQPDTEIISIKLPK